MCTSAPVCPVHRGRVEFLPAARASGGIGRRAGFRCQCLHGRGGSSPPSRTEPHKAPGISPGALCVGRLLDGRAVPSVPRKLDCTSAVTRYKPSTVVHSAEWGRSQRSQSSFFSPRSLSSFLILFSRSGRLAVGECSSSCGHVRRGDLGLNLLSTLPSNPSVVSVCSKAPGWSSVPGRARPSRRDPLEKFLRLFADDTADDWLTVAQPLLFLS